MNYTITADPMTDHQLQQYLNKIEYDGHICPTYEVLSALQYAHLTHIPYENLDSLERKVTSLNHDALFQKMILGTRGGICFELNGLYAWLLEKIGFKFKNHASRYIFADDMVQMRRHRVMTVTIDDQRYLTDVGVNSESPRRPLRLVESEVQSDGVSEYRFEKDPFWGWLLWQKLRGHSWHRLYGFTEEPQLDMDYVMPCVFCDLHPDSPINKFEKVSIFTEDSNIRIWNGEYQTFSHGLKEIRPIDSEERLTLLKRDFGIIKK
ncbi:MAG: arylamine N-acetyltransferase [Firmicutes bacterium]|nr:arylamine N-acetyltransferase [Bacillota bacterium]